MEKNKEQAELCLELTLVSPSAREPPGFFLCVYCDRKFYNSQALGGHQNAHKDERAKRRREIAAASRGQVRRSTDLAGLFSADKRERAETQKDAAADTMPALTHTKSFPVLPECGVGRVGGLDLSLRL